MGASCQPVPVYHPRTHQGTPGPGFAILGLDRIWFLVSRAISRCVLALPMLEYSEHGFALSDPPVIDLEIPIKGWISKAGR